MSNPYCNLACEISSLDESRKEIKAQTALFIKKASKGGAGGKINKVTMGATNCDEVYVQKMTQSGSKGAASRNGYKMGGVQL